MEMLLQLIVNRLIQLAEATTESCSMSTHYQPDLRCLKEDRDDE